MDQAGLLSGGRGLNLAGCHIHFVGIGGCGMSGLARLVRGSGAVCSGSDIGGSEVIDALRGEGFEVTIGQGAEVLPKRVDAVVVSAAIPPGHPESSAARRRGVPVLKYAEMLGQLMDARTGVAIAGTHGKSTTTSMLCHVLLHCGLDPSFIVGATCAQIGGGARCGGSEVLVAEACEFDRSFHSLRPTHSVILNVEEDHLDVYGSLDAIVEAYQVFATSLPAQGSLLIQHETPHRLALTAGLDCPVETIGYAPQADWRVELERVDGSSGSSVRLSRGGDDLVRWEATIPGEHMAYNAAVAAVTANRLGAPWPGISEALSGFAGLSRRMELLGGRRASGGPVEVTVVDDYGHHPTEIDTTLRALRAHHRPGRLICVFQPHQHSRTRFLLDQFAASFEAADLVIVPEIYFVRDSEAERHTVSAEHLVERLHGHGKNAAYLHPFSAIVTHLRETAQGGDLIVTMGAGDVWKVARDYLDSA